MSASCASRNFRMWRAWVSLMWWLWCPRSKTHTHMHLMFGVALLIYAR